MNLYRSFYEWIEQHRGSIHPHLQIDVKDEQRGLFATDHIEGKSALVTIPWSLVINRKHPALAEIDIDDEHRAIFFFLLNEYRKKEQSIWFPWIQLFDIDQQAKDFLNERMQLFEYVQSSTLGQALVARYEQLQGVYAELDLPEISLEVFCMIDHLVWSRILDLPENQPVSLVPMIDFANHSLEPSARWFIDDEQKHLILRAERSLCKGEEIMISYGSKSNEELLYLYAFALPCNPNDRVTLPVSLAPDDPLLDEKLALLQSLNLPARLTLDIDGHLTKESETLAKILSTQSMDVINQTHQWYLPYLCNLFDTYQKDLNASIPNDIIFVQYYLNSQKSIIAKAIEVNRNKSVY